MTTGQWLTAGDDQTFWYDPGTVSLDFAYTGAVGGPPQWQKLRTPDDLGRWLGERYAPLDPAATDADLADAVRLRAAITAAAMATVRTGRPAAADVATVNAFAARTDVAPALDPTGHRTYVAPTTAGRALAAIARDAVATLDRAHDGRLRECGADDCPLVFVDDTRAGTRRWCSMQRCGNRTKVRRHRARTGPEKTHPEKTHPEKEQR